MAVPTTCWVADALCARIEADQLFARGAAQRSARSVCLRCPVRLDCLTYALTNGDEYGVWGGLTERERRAVRRVAHVEDWGTWLRRSPDPLAAALRDPQGSVSVLAVARDQAAPESRIRTVGERTVADN